MLDVTTGAATPITPEGVVGVLVSPDAKTLVVNDQGSLRLFLLNSGAATPLKGVEPGDQAIRWAADGRAIFVSRTLSPRQRDLARSTWRPDAAR